MGDVPHDWRWWLRYIWWRYEERILKLICFLAGIYLLAVILQGCATFDYDWKQTRPASIKPWLYVYALDIDTVCRMVGAQAASISRINGCAQWRPVGCVIYLPENPPDFLILHEQRHCMGETHD